jgi:hypothetical protein
MEPKFAYGNIVYIKKGFFRGYKATIKAFEEIKVKNQKTEEEENFIRYEVTIDEVKDKDRIQSIREDWLIKYKKYVIF